MRVKVAHLGVAPAANDFCSKKRPPLGPREERGLADGSFFGAESERFWHDDDSITVLSGDFRVLCIDNYLAKL